MTSGKKLALLTSLLLPLTCLATPTPDADAARALVASLNRPAPARTAFAEARFMRVLDKPLVVSGELAWLGGDRLERRVDTPMKETSTIADGEVTQEREGKKPRSFSLKRAPQLKVLLDSFVALLAGDPSRLGESFEIALGRDADRWQLTLTPRDPRIAKQIASIHVYGSGNVPRCMRMDESDGDTSIDLLGELATKMPAEPTREGLIAQCGGAM
ncbi:LolA-related protein [Luteibacter sp. E-22]|uniref:LolA-related protein n=1 Tax=Luteibacter sp. E-22 TaxID=3404050 RepID=UPI003CE72C0D